MEDYSSLKMRWGSR